MNGYEVDVDDLIETIAAMAACGRELGDLRADIEATTVRLHGEWAGLAREAHAASHGRWSDEFASMSTALDGLRDVGETARANYTSAVEANVGLWERVR